MVIYCHIDVVICFADILSVANIAKDACEFSIIRCLLIRWKQILHIILWVDILYKPATCYLNIACIISSISSIQFRCNKCSICTLFCSTSYRHIDCWHRQYSILYWSLYRLSSWIIRIHLSYPYYGRLRSNEIDKVILDKLGSIYNR